MAFLSYFLHLPASTDPDLDWDGWAAGVRGHPAKFKGWLKRAMAVEL